MAPAHGSEIPQERWAAFFEGLSRDFQDADVTIETVAPDDQPQLLIYGLPLADVVCDERLTIRLGDGAQHVVERPTGVLTERDPDGLSLVVTVQVAGGPPVRITLARGQQRTVGGAVTGGEARDVADPGFIGASAGAAGGSAAAGDGRDAPGVGDDYGPLITFGASDDMGGVAGVGGGSLGDQDLSGRRAYDITADVYGGSADDLLDDASMGGEHVGPGSEGTGATSSSYAQGSTATSMGHHQPEIIDGGGDQGVIDPTIDPIEGTKLDPANDDSDPYVEGEVGAQAERDLADLADDHPELDRRD